MGQSLIQSVTATRIKPLSLQLANQIAAGEVVERPASVVKELLENALDSGATQITIDIERGGSSLIRVADNGQGIVKQDLSLAVTRHATSKLHSLNELEQVNSLGFRGEALASISAVSRLSIKSLAMQNLSAEDSVAKSPALKKTGVDDDRAWMINTGTDTDFANYTAEPEPVSHLQGTTVEVRDLFFNTPARRKFLRTTKTEFHHIDEIVKRIALSRFNIAFKLSHNNKILRNLPKAVTDRAISHRISKLLAPEFIQYAQRVDFSAKNFTQSGHIRLWGWVVSHQLERKQPDWQLFYVNGRFIRDKLVNHALRQVFQHLLSAENYPAYVLYLEIDPAQVDVNVHPTKHEVRFRQTRLVHDFIYSALNQALNSQEQGDEAETAKLSVEKSVTETTHSQSEYATDPDMTVQNAASQGITETQAYYNRFASRVNVPSFKADPVNPDQVNVQLQGLKDLYQTHTQTVRQEKENVFGQYLCSLGGKYMLTQQGERLFIIDIDKALQRIFDVMFKPGKKKSILIPHSVALKTSKLEQLLFNQSLLSEWGMDISQISPETVLFRSLPATPFLLHCSLEPERFVRSWLQVMPAEKLDVNRQETFYQHFINSLKSAISLSSLTTESLLEIKQQLEHIIISTGQGQEHPADKQKIWTVLKTEQLDVLFNH